MKFLALDLSVTCTGYALADGTPGVIRPTAGLGLGFRRLQWTRDQVVGLAKAQRTDLAVLEGYSFDSVNTRAHQTGELGGVIRLALFEAGIRHVDVPPSNLKQYAIGNGGAKKPAILAEAIRQLGYQGSSDDEADALWLREMAVAWYSRQDIAVPKKRKGESLDVIRVRALAGVEWPEIMTVIDRSSGLTAVDLQAGPGTVIPVRHPSAAADALFVS